MSVSNSMPEAGQKAPDFFGRTGDGSTLSLSDFKGKKLALYFYPEDNTPGCTKQACNLRDNFNALKKAGIHVVGVSDDTAAKHQEFASEFKLPFPLIADTDRSIMKSYGVYGAKKLFGHSYIGTRRTTFLIDEDGTIVHVFKRPKVEAHAEEIMKGFNE